MKFPWKRIQWQRSTTQTLAVVAGLALALVTLGAVTSDSATPGTEGATQPAELLAVSTLEARQDDGYEVRDRFVGRIEATRDSAIGFELAGRVEEVMVDEGDRVARGAALARLDLARLQARRAELAAALEEARAALELAQLTRDRHREALDIDAVSSQAYDVADRGLAAREAAVRRAEAGLETIDVELEKSTLRAPFDAWVAARLVDEGRVVEAGMPMLHLLEAGEPEARIGLAGRAADALTTAGVGSIWTIEVGDREMSGRLKALLPVVSDATRSVEAVFRLAAELGPHGGTLRRGELATVTVPRSLDEDGFWLPRAALTESSRGLWACYVAEPALGQHVLTRRELELLHQDGDRVFVRGPLADGERVVTEGLHRLVPGLAVRLAGGGEARDV